MKKKNIALVAGGDSGEYIISVNSASVISKNLPSDLFEVFTIMIKGSNWIYINENGQEKQVDKNDFSILWDGEKVNFDCALITIHGSPGEDGKLQGYFDMLKIPYTTSGQLACSVTFNKYFCNSMAAYWGVKVARSAKFSHSDDLSPKNILSKVNLPVFVKPNKGGSSLGTSFVKNTQELEMAVRACLEHDDEALVEEFIDGTELTCGVFRRRGELIVLPVTEIVSKSDAKFFDYQAKYTKGAADEITPARISTEVFQLVQKTTAFLYEKFELKGVSRLDFIYSQNGLYFLEANITPGMSERSIVPQQAAYIGISLRELFTDIINEAVRTAHYQK
jgi:D-alanine-D-alanine ligase